MPPPRGSSHLDRFDLRRERIEQQRRETRPHRCSRLRQRKTRRRRRARRRSGTSRRLVITGVLPLADTDRHPEVGATEEEEEEEDLQEDTRDRGAPPRRPSTDSATLDRPGDTADTP